MRHRKKLFIRWASILLCGLWGIMGVLAADNETHEIMPFVKDNSACLACHSREELDTEYTDATKSCDTFCRTCHSSTKEHHKVGMEVDSPVPEGIFIRDNKRLQCVSCHNLNRDRFDSRPWRSQSLFGSIFRSKDKYKTFYLAINNRKGQLCKNCH